MGTRHLILPNAPENSNAHSFRSEHRTGDAISGTVNCSISSTDLTVNTDLTPTRKAERVVAYIDGFNLYFGLKESGWRCYYWLNVRKLAENLLTPVQELQHTKYFTSRISQSSEDPDKHRRQQKYIEALQTVEGCSLYFGRYQNEKQCCRCCGAVALLPHEKMTDVNIAVEMLTDAFQDKFDTALLISGDSDLVGVIKALRHLFPAKRVVMGFPPNRAKSYPLRQVANAYFEIREQALMNSQLPLEVMSSEGHVLKCPELWQKQSR